ncbi:MAG: resolvase [Spirosoma sp.]|nr:resolvase [Spirosoma sp.]
MKIRYARVSSQDQNLFLQHVALKAAGCERIYEEKASGAKADRPELLRMIDHAREGDAIVIWKLDRLGRSLAHLVELVSELEQKGIGLISLNGSQSTL